MSTLSFKSNIEEIITQYKKKKLQVKPAILRGINVGMIRYHGYIEKTQLSGRPGLKTQTGTLKRSFYTRKTANGSTLATREKYARIHQFGGVIKHPGGTPYIVTGTGKATFLRKDGSYPKSVKFTKPHSITIPKRLHIYEKFRTEGKRLILDSIKRSLLKGI